MSALDEQIARDWPKQWARANDQSRVGASKRRNNLRRQYRAAMAFEEWRTRNPKASCASCKFCLPYPHRESELICDLQSTGGAYGLTTETDVCIDWKKK